MRRSDDSSHCIIACQGSAQLVAALVAAGLRPGAEHERRSFSVVVHDLHVQTAQSGEFVLLVTQLAQGIPGCRAVRFVSVEQMDELRALRDRYGLDRAARRLVESLALERPDEIYLGQNPLLLNELMRWAYRASTKVCYGDGVGLNFTSRYFAPAGAIAAPPAPLRPWLARAASGLARGARSRLPRLIGEAARDPGFDHHRLLMPNLFDERIGDYEATDPAAFRELFAACVRLQRPELQMRSAELRARALVASEVVVMLSTNFSEAGKMSLAAELEAYAEFLAPLATGPRALLVIKPHPRDSQSKIQQLNALLASRFAERIVLDDPTSFYLPFEVLYTACFADWPGSRMAPTIACFSTAGLSLEYLYGAPCLVGFGDELVKRHMFDQWREQRLQHEHDLRDAATVVRRNRALAADERVWPRPR